MSDTKRAIKARKHDMDGSKLHFLIREPAEVYHAKSRAYLGSHRLAEFRNNPPLFRKRELGLIPDEDRPAFLLGRAAHTLILEGQVAYEATYAIGGPINPSTGAPFGTRTRAFQAWAEAKGKPVLSHDQALQIEAMQASVLAHPVAAELLEEGVAEGVVRTELSGVPCQGRFDWLNPTQGLVDLKTCESLDWLEADARNYGYPYQLAFYRALLAKVAGTLFPVHLIAVEKREPFRCGVWRLTNELLAAVDRENEAALVRLKRCRETDIWPSGYETTRVLDSM